MSLNLIRFLTISVTAILLYSNRSFAQKYTVLIKGSVKELNSALSLPFSSISVLNTTRGTISNEAGNFELNLPSEFSDDTLRISYVGYTTVLLPISKLVDRLNVLIELPKETRLLSEIMVTGKKPNAKRIVMKALGRISKNYIARPYRMEAFYREQIFNAAKKSFNSLECVVDIDDPGIRRSDSLVQIQMKEMRKGDDYLPSIKRDSLVKSFVNRIFTGHDSYNNVYWIVGENSVRTHGYRHQYDQYLYVPILKPGFIEQLEFEITDYWIDSGLPIYEISFREKEQPVAEYSRKEFNSTLPKKLLEKPTLNLDSLYEVAKQSRKSFTKAMGLLRGKIHIDATDFGIVKLVYENKMVNPSGVWMLWSRIEMQYAKYDEKYYLKFICDVSARKKEADEKYTVKYLQVNTIENNKDRSRVDQNGNFQEMSRWDDLWNLKYEYHPSFWSKSDYGFLPNFDVSKLISIESK